MLGRGVERGSIGSIGSNGDEQVATEGRSADSEAGGESTPSSRMHGNAITWWPDLAALVAGGVGAAVLDGVGRWLCGLACVVVLVGLAVRSTSPGSARRTAGPTASAMASLPALLLLASILYVAYAAPIPGSGWSSEAPPSPAIRTADAPPAARDCLASEAATAYLEALHRRLEQAWDEQPESAGEGGFVVLGFMLDAEGRVRLSRIIDQSSDAYRGFGKAALAQAAPYGPLSGELACLEQVELRATLDRTGGN